ncbi:mitochondrial distribution and morphology family 33, partial [Calocera cornea HHB12733]
TTASAKLESLGGSLNRLTGYDEIEGLKRAVRDREEGIARLQAASRAAKRQYEAAVSTRSACQREVNDLLQRKSMWTEPDVSRFTELVRQDHTNEQSELAAKALVAKSEEEVERGQTELMQTILHRYHEEQVWSDKIRGASTYGSLVALGINLVVFVGAVLFVEPWKRKRLAETFEKRVVEMTGEMEGVVKEEVTRLVARLGEMEQLLRGVV